MKHMPDLDKKFFIDSFGHPNLKVFTDEKLLFKYLTSGECSSDNILLMSSGNFSDMSLKL